MKPRAQTPQTMTLAQRQAVESSVRAAFEELTPAQLTELVMEPYRSLRTKG